jgi:hypothetical protein
LSMNGAIDKERLPHTSIANLVIYVCALLWSGLC